ncbi:hypothetical protein MPH_00955 [Macrophomina phaseolina MS6]|uniref:Uncharacterized protein n=1 Tax=Macrophomina phaseolina (strain MS6) TaxID=1126212 RepID=K2SYP5_MACPH|nr:hypothetical protein MPH_00955 [Macrophomina phaseolina MS6]
MKPSNRPGGENQSQFLTLRSTAWAMIECKWTSIGKRKSIARKRNAHKSWDIRKDKEEIISSHDLKTERLANMPLSQPKTPVVSIPSHVPQPKKRLPSMPPKLGKK